MTAGKVGFSRLHAGLSSSLRRDVGSRGLAFLPYLFPIINVRSYAPESERKGQTRKREADQINDCFTRSSLCERRRWLSPSEIEERTGQRKWKGRGTCQARNQRVSCVILTLGEEKREKVGTKSADGVTLSFCTNYFPDFCNEKNMWYVKTALGKGFVIEL